MIISILTVSILFISAAAGFDISMATDTGKSNAEAAVLPGSGSGKIPNGKPTDDKTPGGLFPIEAFHKVVRQEREATLLEIDKDLEAVLEHLSEERMAILKEMENMREATLDYLTGERKEVVEKLITELSRITELMVAERKTTMLELEVAGNRIVEGAMQRSERLIDHFFIRLSQLLLVVAIILGIISLVVFRVLSSRNRKLKTS